jgi:copper(I)-binding protein
LDAFHHQGKTSRRLHDPEEQRRHACGVDQRLVARMRHAHAAPVSMLMLHQSKEVNGVEKMLPVKSITVPAHGNVSFAPGGFHLMCMKPQATMQIGHSVPVTLKFADGETVSAQYPVKGPSGK